MEFNDNRFSSNPEKGAGFYDCPNVLYYDLIGLIPREHLSWFLDK